MIRKSISITLFLVSLTCSAQVGINTTSPTSKLDINGDLRVRDVPVGTDELADKILVIDDDGNVKRLSSEDIVKEAESASLPTGVQSITRTNALIWLDTSASQYVGNGNYTTVKSFDLPGGSLGTRNAVKIQCYRRRVTGNDNMRIRLKYGGSTFFSTTNLGTEVSKIDMVIYGEGATNAQRAFIDDANTGNNGQKTGTLAIDSTQDHTVEIQFQSTASSPSTFELDYCSAELQVLD